MKLQTRQCLLTAAVVLAFCVQAISQVVTKDTLALNAKDTVSVSVDSLSLSKTAKGKVMLDGKIDYASADSLSFDIRKKMAYMYGNAMIKYQDIKLNAAEIIIDFNKSIVYANAATDSAGKTIGIPDFTQGTLNFKSNSLSYNFNTKKGLIKNVVTQEGGGYLHATVIKKLNDNVSETGPGMFTTCDLDHPHFAIKYSRAKVIPGDKIVTGPAYLSIEDVPLPLVLPFGLFPNKKGRSSGIKMPTWGEMTNQGFYLMDGGYYFGLSDHFDLLMVGDIYSRGSWALKPSVNYKKRYKYSGNFSLKYANNVLGVQGTPSYSKSKDFFITWSHRQDPKARPNGIFSAMVQAGSRKFNKYNSPNSVNDYLTNTFSSSISYNMRLGDFANLSTSASHSQNTSTGDVTITLPTVEVGFNRYYPFKRKIQSGNPAWYESISITYSMNLKNQITEKDSLLFKPESMHKFISGVKHTIPLSGSFKLFKYFTWSHSINYTENWFPRTIRKTWINEQTIVNGDTLAPHVQVDTIRGIRAAREYNYSSSIGTTVYGMLHFKHGPVRAIRHVVKPSVNFGYRPDFGRAQLGYYKTVQTDTLGNTQTYSIFQDGTYLNAFTSPPGRGRSGTIGFSLNNNLEMKVKSKSDTVTGEQKIMLIDNMLISSSYDLVKDSMRLSPVSVSARTTLFKKINITYSGSFSPYATNSKGIYYNKYQWDVNKKLLNFMNSAWNLSVGYDIKPKQKKADKPTPASATEAEMSEIKNNPDEFIDWDNPWNVHLDYTFNYNCLSLTTGKRQKTIVQTLNVSGDLSVTDKWKITARTGYDFKNKDFSYTSFSVYRNLHCWEMRFNWIPYGFQKSWNFQINVKSSVLQDLKLTKKKDFRDNL